jgi:transposase-like protein
MARRQQLLGELEQAGRPRKVPKPPPDPSPRYPPEVKAKAYAAYLDGAGWADCARAIGHTDPNGAGSQLIVRWADEDKWSRSPRAGDYMAKVEAERASDPNRISNEIDQLCVKMQRVCEDYVGQFFDEDGHVVISSAFKSRDFADMAASLRMIHETRIKIRKANEPKDGAGKDGQGKDILSIVREAGLNRLKENRRRGPITPVVPPDDPEDDDVRQQESQAPGAGAEPVILPSFGDLRARLEAAAGEGGPAEGSLEIDPGPDGQC